MAEHIGTVADVATGEVQVGYAAFHALLRANLIYGRDEIVRYPIDAYQLKIRPAGDGEVRVDIVDLAVGIVQARQMFSSIHNPVAGEQEANDRVADEVIRLARELKPDAILRVTRP